MSVRKDPRTQTSEFRVQETQHRLVQLERRDWWLWATSCFVMFLLTVAVISFSFPTLMRTESGFFEFHMDQAIRGLTGLVLLFNTYVIYQQLLIKRLRCKLAEQIVFSTKMEMNAEKYQELALRDSLTGLANRRYAEEYLITEMNRSTRHGTPLVLMALDLDEFKTINDRFGHSAGDRVLAAFAEKLRTSFRESDFPARMGGDEFMVLLPECDPSRVAFIIRRLHGVKAIHNGISIPVSFSAGWTEYKYGESLAQLLERADQLLYEAKRNRKEEATQESLVA